MQDSAELHRDESISSTMESTQEYPAHRNVLKQQSKEDDTEAQSESELEKEALKLSDSMKRGDASFRQSDLKDEAMSDDKLLESDDALLKQSELEDEILSNNKPSGSIDRDNDSLKHSGLEADQPTAKKRSRSSLDSVSSKRRKKITSLTQKGKNFTGKHVHISFFSQICNSQIFIIIR